ncbi:hypothetical protein Q4591_00865 [Shewanella sp. 3_MG-2023]|uniref:hypothetical protein n=1 Tax=unclassified Shewanella TaxID=196818 RepID=UPI0026E179C4|nr:hypothetical protein [Shewanella sp. 3_MG-2023]MDO6773895.1 hypothetical protein [Shewanella sp. 3_MG-2023]
MSLWKALYDVFEKEHARVEKHKGQQRALLFEIEANINFIAVGLKQGLSADQIVAGIDVDVFKQSMIQGYDFNRLTANSLLAKAIIDYPEFDKYIGKSSDELVANVYGKIFVLQKLMIAGRFEQAGKLKSLLRMLILVLFHLQGRALPKRKSS